MTKIDFETYADMTDKLYKEGFKRAVTPELLLDMYEGFTLSDTHDTQETFFGNFVPDIATQFIVDIHLYRDEEFIEQFARLALDSESLQFLPFLIMAFAPSVPSWSGDMLDWLVAQDKDTTREIVEDALSRGRFHPVRRITEDGKGEAEAFTLRYSAYENAKTLAHHIC